MTPEEMKRDQERYAADRKTAARLLRSPDGEALLRYLRPLLVERGVGSDPQATAYRVARRDVFEMLTEIREEEA